MSPIRKETLQLIQNPTPPQKKLNIIIHIGVVFLILCKILLAGKIFNIIL